MLIISNNACTPSGITATDSQNPKIDLSASTEVVIANNFSLTTTGQPAPQYKTQVSLRYEPATQLLQVNFVNANNPYVKQNQYITHNSTVWQQEVFEMFIAVETNETPQQYIEIEINPNNALFSALITNPNGRGTENNFLYIDAITNGITHHVTTTASTWSGQINFPLALLGKLGKSYRVNFFRVLALQSHTLDQANFWSCTPDTCVYLAWSPTMSGSVPAFHVPKYFGQLNIMD